MTLILDLPGDVDERLQQDADRKGIPKESLAIDIIARSVGSQEEASFWTPGSFESLARKQRVEPIRDFQGWLANLPDVEGADELADRVTAARQERREIERTHP